MTDQQLTDDDLKGMTPQEIADAHDSGRLDSLLGAPEEDVDVLARARNGESLDRADLSRLSALGRHDLILAADAAGLIVP